MCRHKFIGLTGCAADGKMDRVFSRFGLDRPGPMPCAAVQGKMEVDRTTRHYMYL